MRNLWKIIAAAALVCTSSVASADVTIDFGGLPGSNAMPFIGPYVEDGITVTATGTVYEGHIFGNPLPSLFYTETGVIQLTSPSLFQLISFDQISLNGSSSYSVQGFNDATLVYTLSGTMGGNAWDTTAGVFADVNRLVFTLTTQGTSGNLDNVVLATTDAVPEPGTWMLMLVGFGMIGFAVRKARLPATRPA
jgi:hypothetical protein